MDTMLQISESNCRVKPLRGVGRVCLAVAFCLLALGVPALLLAEENGKQDDLDTLSLEQLLDIRVTAATKSSLSARKTPGVVRVFTQQDIQRLGFTSMRDILSHVPGIQVQEYRAGHQLAWVRGVQARYNNKVLLLIDGVPMRDGYYGHFDIAYQLPVEQVERIEIINGPGSVLYGANAFSGVISITTRSRAKDPKGIVDYGSFNTPRAAAELGPGNFYGFASYAQSDGYSPTLNVDGEAWQHRQESKALYSLVKYTTESFSVFGSYSYYDYPQKYRKSKQDYYWNRQPLYGAARYTKDFNSKGRFNVLGYYQRYGFGRDKQKFESVDVLKSQKIETLDTSLMGFDADYSIQLGSHQMILGSAFQQDRAVNFEQQQIFPLEPVEPSLLDPDVVRNAVGFYADERWSLGQNTLVTGGIRYDVLSDFENQFSYRVGFTHQTDSNLYGKVLYGTAYRVPSYREYLDITSYNLALVPEHLNTFEAQVGYFFSRGDMNVTFFANDYHDFIRELAVASIVSGEEIREIDDEYAVNADNRTIRGLEISSTFYPTERLSLSLGSGILFDKTEEVGSIDPGIVLDEELVLDRTDLPYLADFTFNFLTSYRVSSWLTVGARGVFFGDRNTPPAYQSDVPDGVKDASNAEGFSRLDIVSSLNLSRDLQVSLELTNVFDSLIYSQPIGGDSDFDIQWPGRAFRFGLRYQVR